MPLLFELALNTICLDGKLSALQGYLHDSMSEIQKTLVVLAQSESELLGLWRSVVLKPNN